MAHPNSNEINGCHYFKQVADLSQQYQHVFSNFQTFNLIQSQLMDEILYTDFPIVVSAPTGSGKTVLFEFAIIRLLEKCQKEESSLINKKILYLAPVKALCTERFNDWECKFRKLGLKAIEVTGDSDEGNILAIQHFNLVLTTPEKWDSLTRKWRDHTSLVEVIKLILIDEVHLLNEERRGSTLEAVVSRMKTIQESSKSSNNHIRFIAVSATIPNIEDVAAWLGKKNDPAKYYKFGEEVRPVHLNKVVKSYPFKESMSYYKFDLNLSYKLKQIILEYSEGKPALIFCSTRKAVTQTSTTLLQNITFHFTPVQKMTLEEAHEGLLDSKLKDMVKYGVGFHHAGLSASDRHSIEELFKSGFLPVLVSTTMGVNLPAHLVIIKSTAQYVNGLWEEYSEAQILQMMGRAGRPQFDSSATAVILTKDTLKEKYEKLVSGKDIVESNLHRNLAEHLNSEIVLHTITDIAVAVYWLRSTFLYIRAQKNPRRYGIGDGLSGEELEARLQAMCMRELNGLEKYELIKKTDFAYNVEPTENGKLMARLYIAFETMKLFMKVKGTEKIPKMLEVICQCHEFSDIQLRVNERNTLNLLNKSKSQETIRFPLNGKIKTKEMKINCLIQAALGCLSVQDISLAQESIKVLRIAERLVKALSLYLWQKNWYEGLASALILTKSIVARMWENSVYVARQLPGIGPALASLLVTSRKTTLKSIIESNPRDLERIINKHPPFGNSLQETAKSIPQYSLEVNYQQFSKKIYIYLKLLNFDKIIDSSHTFNLLIAGCNNELLRKEKIRDAILIEQKGEINFTINIQPEMNIEAVIVHLISDKLVGVDIKKVVAIFSKYQFFSQEEAENFYSAEQSLVSSEKTHDRKPAATTKQKKSLKKLPQKKQNSMKGGKDKVKSDVKSKYQASLSQYAFKSSRGQLKHFEIEKNSSDNEVSSTQDHILKYNSSPKFIYLEKCVGVDDRNSADISVELDERRMKMDMENNCYMQNNRNILTKTEQNKIINKVTPNMFHGFDYITAITNHNYNPPYLKVQNTQNNETIRSKYDLHRMEEPNFQKCQLPNSQCHCKISNNTKNCYLLRENESNVDKNLLNEICNFETSYSSNRNMINTRAPFQLSPRQFLKSGKHIEQKSNALHKSESNFRPYFMPLDNKKKKEEDATEGVKTKCEGLGDKGTISGVQEIYDIDDNCLNNDTLYLKPHALLQRKQYPNQSYMQRMKNQKYNKEDQVETNPFNGTGKVLQKNFCIGKKITQETHCDSMNSLNDLVMMKADQVGVYKNSVTEKSHIDFENNTQEVKEVSYSQLDDLFFDSPQKEEQEATYLEEPFTNESNTSARSTEIEDTDDTVIINDDFSPTFGIHNVTNKCLGFIKSTGEAEVLSVGEVEPYNDSENDSDSEYKLRSDYGDPFAPVHNSVTIQRLFNKSDNVPKETLSFSSQEREPNIYMKSSESIYTNSNSVDLNYFASKKKSFVKDCENNHGKQMKEQINYLAIENNPYNQPSQPEGLHIHKANLNTPSIKNFFPIHKGFDCKHDYTNYPFSGRNNFGMQSDFQNNLAVQQPRPLQQVYNPPENFNEVQTSHKEVIDYFSFPSPNEIDSFKKKMFQNSIFSQKSNTIKKLKSDHSEAYLGRLSNLLYNKRNPFKKSSFYSCHSASSLSPKATAFRLVPQKPNQSRMESELNNQKITSATGQLLFSKSISNEHSICNLNPFSNDASLLLFPPASQQTISPPIENNYQNYSVQQTVVDSYLKSMTEQLQHQYNISECHYDKHESMLPSSRNINSEQLPFPPSQVFQPSTFNETDLSPGYGDKTSMEEELNRNISPDGNMPSSPSFDGSLHKDVRSPLSGE